MKVYPGVSCRGNFIMFYFIKTHDSLIIKIIYVIKYEQEKRLDTDSRKWKQFLEEYAEIERYLKESFLEKGNEKTYCDMIELIIRVADYVFRDKENVRKGFGDVMGGKVLELESDKLIQKGIEQGIAMERQNTELVRQKAEAEIQRLKKLLEEKNNKQ